MKSYLGKKYLRDTTRRYTQLLRMMEIFFYQHTDMTDINTLQEEIVDQIQHLIVNMSLLSGSMSIQIQDETGRT